MKNIVLAFVLLGALVFLFISACINPANNKLFCNADSDCICDGFDIKADTCFLGNKYYYEKYVDKERDCADFCTGFAGNYETRCVDNKCTHVIKGE